MRDGEGEGLPGSGGIRERKRGEGGRGGAGRAAGRLLVPAVRPLLCGEPAPGTSMIERQRSHGGGLDLRLRADAHGQPAVAPEQPLEGLRQTEMCVTKRHRRIVPAGLCIRRPRRCGPVMPKVQHGSRRSGG